jgi:hypothetical protein
VVETPSVGQVHILTALGIRTTPTVGAPLIGVIHALSAEGIIITPEVEEAMLGFAAQGLVIVLFTLVSARAIFSSSNVTATFTAYQPTVNFHTFKEE